MKVILNKDVKTMGKKGEIVEVAEGYGRNYLIPKGIAVEANAQNINTAKIQQGAKEKKSENEKASAKKLAEKLTDIKLTVKAKAGENGKLFGSITNQDIADKLKEEHNVTIDKKKISSDSIKSLGDHKIEIKVYPGITAEVAVSVIGV